MAAGGLMVLEAGGRVTTLRGGPWRLDDPGLIASNGEIHGAMLEVLHEVRERRP
jgi:myo-inositol-1(or 4)-monophosphatase